VTVKHGLPPMLLPLLLSKADWQHNSTGPTFNKREGSEGECHLIVPPG
jgi:hypothetical protein